VLQAKSAAAGHAVTKDYYDYLKSQGNQKNIDLIIDNIDKARDPKRWENVIRDSQTTSTDPIMVAKRNAALEQLRQRDLEVKANISLLPLELQRMFGGKQTITMEDIQAAATKSRKSVEQVKADALAKGYVIQ
jgi:hypothetical protein